jgi:nicotinamidase-related amidase
LVIYGLLHIRYKYTESITLNDDDYISPDRKHSALIILDVQRDFTLIGSSTEIPGTLQVVQYIHSLVQAYRELANPIFHVVRLYRADGSNVDMCRRKQIENGKQMVVPGDDGAELMDELKTLSFNQAGFRSVAFW